MHEVESLEVTVRPHVSPCRLVSRGRLNLLLGSALQIVGRINFGPYRSSIIPTFQEAQIQPNQFFFFFFLNCSGYKTDM
jgi:hypothetical protein